MKTSVAMCTYNGEKFLKEQIDSILHQTIPVDEIVVCDDGSTDSTHNILRHYEIENPGIFRIFINEKNIGSVKNFEKAITLCKNEIIFLSDQDDVWMPGKVKEILEFFSENEKIQMVGTEGFGIDEDSKTLDVFTIWELPRKLNEQNKKFNYSDYISFIGNLATGASMAFRKDFLESVLPFPAISDYHHDEWLAFVASENDAFAIIPKELFKYRKHEKQQVGGVFYKNSERRIARLLSFSDFNKHSSEKDFLYYKTALKRLAQAYKKFDKLSNTETVYQSIFTQKKEKAKFLFEQNMLEVKRKYPIKYRILSVFDAKKDKRKIWK